MKALLTALILIMLSVLASRLVRADCGNITTTYTLGNPPPGCDMCSNLSLYGPRTFTINWGDGGSTTTVSGYYWSGGCNIDTCSRWTAFYCFGR
jgi:hypothetical protein